MRFVKFILKVMFILALFITGLSLAEKEMISQRVIGLELPEGLYGRIEELIDSTEIENAGQLCIVLNDYGLEDRAVVRNKYFKQTQVENGVIPAGVYETVCMGDSLQDNRHYLLLTNQLEINNDSWLHRSYISFLSVLGYLEKIMNYLMNTL